MPSSTALQLLRAFTFQPGGRISIGYSPWKTTVLVLTRHFRAVYSGCSGAWTEKSTLGTALDSHSARRPSNGIAAESGWSRHPGRDRRSISLCLPPINTLYPPPGLRGLARGRSKFDLRSNCRVPCRSCTVRQIGHLGPAVRRLAAILMQRH